MLKILCIILALTGSVSAKAWEEIQSNSSIIYLSPSPDSSKPDFRPNFQWRDNEPFKNIRYYFKLVELTESQVGNPARAIFQNRPVIEQRSIRTTSLRFPPIAQSLVRGKMYAWTVISYELSETFLLTSPPDGYSVFRSGAEKVAKYMSCGDCKAKCNGACAQYPDGDCLCFEALPPMDTIAPFPTPDPGPFPIPDPDVFPIR